MTTYNITVTSDITCPWCYIGHTRLTKAITAHKKAHPSDTFHITYKPFYINGLPPQVTRRNGETPPAFPVPSRLRRDFVRDKFGPVRARQVEAMLTQAARAEGLDFKFGGMTGNSRNGHRLVHYAQLHGGEEAQDKVQLSLWRKYLEEEVDITRLDVLTRIGVEAGLGTEQEVQRFLESGELGVEVDRLAEEAAREGVSGVPHYVVQDRWEVSGAQESRAFETLFQRYKAIEEKEGKNKKGVKGADGVEFDEKMLGKACGPNGCL